MIDPSLLNALVQGGFAALFVWLLFDTRQDSRKREERLLSALDKFSDQMPKIVDALREIKQEVMRK